MRNIFCPDRDRKSGTGFRSTLGAFRLALLGLAILILAAATPQLRAGSPAAKAEKTYKIDLKNCVGFTAADAARILSVPAAGLKAHSEEMYETLRVCSYLDKNGKGLSFSIAVAESAQDAKSDMEQLRSHLQTAGGTAPFKNKLPKGAYSDISGLGDEAVWTDVNSTLNVRKGNITIQVITPSDKAIQVKIAQAVLAKF